MEVRLNQIHHRDRLNSIDDVQAALQTLGHNLANTKLDKLQNFNTAYLVINRNVRQSLKKDAFSHPDFLIKFDTEFAHYYLDALEKYLSNQQTPKAWSMAFDAALKSKSPLVCMALGVNAHVNNDIPQVLKMCMADKRYYQDYKLINTIIKDSIFEVLDGLDQDKNLVSPKRKILQPAYRLVMTLIIRYWRYTAWAKFSRLSADTTTLASIESSAAGIANRLQSIPI